MTAFCVTCQVGAGLAPPEDTPPKHAELATVIQGDDIPEEHPKEDSLLKGEPEEKTMPSNLEAFIAGECLPGTLDVHVTSSTRCIIDSYGPWLRFIEKHPTIRFVREYPPRMPADTGNGSEPSVAPDTTGQLDLVCTKSLGDGHHSYVLLAPLTLPSTGPAPSIRGAVAVKFSRSSYDEREMLLNEAKIYNAFPRELQEGSSYAPPIVPKFYGYYVPSCEAFDSYVDDDKIPKEERKILQKIFKSHISPILLLEACGSQICSRPLSPTNREKIVMLMHRLHAAGFVQGSFYERNILVQPGPLTSPRSKRSSDDPSYRIIDFGRGKCPSVNCESIKDWAFDAEYERRQASEQMHYSYCCQ